MNLLYNVPTLIKARLLWVSIGSFSQSIIVSLKCTAGLALYVGSLFLSDKTLSCLLMNDLPNSFYVISSPMPHEQHCISLTSSYLNPS